MEPGQCDAFYNESFYFEDPQNTVAKNPIQERVVAALEGGNPPLAKELHEHFSLHPLSDLDKAAVADALQSHALYLRSLEDQHVALPPEYSHLTSDDFVDGGEIAESATYFANYWRREESINNSEPSPGHPDTPEQLAEHAVWRARTRVIGARRVSAALDVNPIQKSRWQTVLRREKVAMQCAVHGAADPALTPKHGWNLDDLVPLEHHSRHLKEK